MTLQQLVCLGGEEQLPETVFVLFLGDRGKHGLASHHLCFHQLALLQAYTVSSVRREESIKKILKKNQTYSCLQETNSRLFLGSGASICQSGSGRFLSQFLAKSLPHSNWESRRTLRMGTQKCQGANAWLQAALRLWHTQWRGEVMNCDPKWKVKQTSEQRQSYQLLCSRPFLWRSSTAGKGIILKEVGFLSEL